MTRTLYDVSLLKEQTKQKVSDAHQKTMVSMVNNPNFSDIRIKTSDGIIHGHRLILGLKCPKIIQVSLAVSVLLPNIWL